MAAWRRGSVHAIVPAVASSGLFHFWMAMILLFLFGFN